MDSIMELGRYTAKSNTCHVCEANARHINHGIASCNACKAFFLRNAYRTDNIRPCRSKGHCKILFKTRKKCCSCRLAKCFSVGMTAVFIPEEFPKKKIACENIKKIALRLALRHQTSSSFSQFTSLNSLCSDRSCLRTSQWRLLSNVIHAFDKFSSITSIRHTFGHLNIVNSSRSDDILPICNLLSSCHTSVFSFITSIPDFRILTIAEQRSLFQRNLHALFLFAGTLILRDGGIFNNERLLMSIYGYDVVCRGKRINMRMDEDSMLVKMISVIIAFSTNCYTVNFDKNTNQDALLRGAFRLFGSQNIYVEILWKYMVYRYDYMPSVLRFAGLIKQILDLITLSEDVYNNNVYQQILVDDVIEQAKIFLSNNNIDSTPLWGKRLDIS